MEVLGGRGLRGLVAALDRLGFDLYGLAPACAAGGGDPATAALPDAAARAALGRRVRSLRDATDCFLFVVVGGSFSDLAGVIGWPRFLGMLHREAHMLEAWSRRRAGVWTAVAEEAVASGAHGVVIADDLAHAAGTFADPRVLRRHFFPVLAAMVAALGSVPVFLHADGRLDAILADIEQAGFAGLHPLEPAAGMRPARVGEATGWRLALAGGIDPRVLTAGGVEAMRAAVRAALPPPPARYLAGTAWGFPDATVDPHRLLELYRVIGEETGSSA